jgi:Transposase IS116/IS110/IS902 family
MKTLPQPWTVAMEATIFRGWICDHPPAAHGRDPSLAERLKNLRTVPGVGPITALTWALEIGDVFRFRSVKQASVVAGFVLTRKAQQKRFCEHHSLSSGRSTSACAGGSRGTWAQTESRTGSGLRERKAKGSCEPRTSGARCGGYTEAFDPGSAKRSPLLHAVQQVWASDRRWRFRSK